MSDDLRARADSRLLAACADLGAADPREPLRERLRELRGSAPDAFERARAHFEAEILPRLAGSAAPADVWIDYARFVGELSGPGRVIAVDAEGRARDCRPGAAYRRDDAGAAPASLVLFLPEDAGLDAFVILQPAAPTAAQQATLALLVERRLAL